MMAREALMTELLGEPGVEVAEEGVMVPKSYLPFFWLLALGQAFVVFVSIWIPLVAFVGGLIFFASHFLFFDWRLSPLTWMVPRTMSANTVAKKGEGNRLFILMAHLDSAPASYAYRADQVKHFATSVHVGTFVMALGVIIPWFDASGYILPVWGRVFIAMLFVGQALVTSVDYWRFGYTPGANDNLSGVSAAVAAASNLWRHMPSDAEVRLVVTTAEEAGMLGAQHYLRVHEDELAVRDTFVLNFDTVGNANVQFVTKSGGFTPVTYDGPLVDAAEALARDNANFSEVRAGEHHVGDFDSIWFQRAGIQSLTIASYDDEGMMPAIHTAQDTAALVSMEKTALAAKFGEGVIRMLPPARKGNDNAR
jgi:hypothetical protein